MSSLSLMAVFLLLLQSRASSHSLVDTSTPKAKHVIKRLADGKNLKLVMSDEFEKDGRDFGKGSDPLFEALEKPDNTNEAMQYYNSSTEYVTTRDGSLVITTRAVKATYNQWDKNHLRPESLTKNYTSGMIQSWNKFCFTGGVLEISLELPGHAESGGLWPALWLMGNLARATFEQSTLDIWPWSYSSCGEVENLEFKQEINACNAEPGYGMHPHQGRGAPEIDIFEVMPGHEMPGRGPINPFMSSSLQVSPGIDGKRYRRPVNGRQLNSSYTWYDGIEMDPERSEFNYGFWGQECGPVIDKSIGRVHKYMEDAISVNTQLNATHFEKQHRYRLEWQPGHRGGVGYLRWYLDDELLLGIQSASLERLTGALVPFEPMYLVMNTALSHRWGMPEPCPVDECSACWHCYDCTNPECQCALPSGMKGCKNLPAEMKVEYIRLYQDPADSSHTLGCSPPSFPTAQFIEAHSERYADWEAMSDASVEWYWTVRNSAVVAVVAAAMLFVLWTIYRWRVAPVGAHRWSLTGHPYSSIPNGVDEDGGVEVGVPSSRWLRG